MNSTLRRIATTTGATAGALALLTGTALAHDCYLGTPTTKTPKSNAWHTIVIQDAVVQFGIFTPECDEQLEAGNDALRAAGLPLSVRVFAESELAAKAPQRVLSDGRGMENFHYGDPFEQIVMTFVGAAATAECATA